MSNDFFEIRDSEVNVEEIMEGIRKSIKERGLSEIEFPDLTPTLLENNMFENCEFSMADFQHNIKDINNTFNIQTHMPIRSHRRGLGKVVVFFKKVVRKCLKWYITPPFDMQREFNAGVTRTLNELSAYVYESNKKIEELQAALSSTNDVIMNLRSAYDADSGKTLNVSEIVKVLPEKQRENDKIIANALSIKNLAQRVINAELNLQDLNKSSKTIISTNMVIGDRLRRIERELKDGSKIQSSAEFAGYSTKKSKVELRGTSNSAPSNSAPSNSTANSEAFDIDYFMFEQLYRGSNEEIAQRQNMYLRYFEGAENVLDIGCGRGEFVELLLKRGVIAKGIDINKDMVYYCEERGLPVELAEALEYLEKLQDNTLGGIFMAQVIEHLKPIQILKLVRVAVKKLKKEGILIMETVNPQCLSVFSNSFYMDMTHEKPVHPLTIKYILESEGFGGTELVYLSEIKEKIPTIKSSEIENLEEVNAALDRVNSLLFGAQDYAIIARK